MWSRLTDAGLNVRFYTRTKNNRIATSDQSIHVSVHHVSDKVLNRCADGLGSNPFSVHVIPTNVSRLASSKHSQSARATRSRCMMWERERNVLFNDALNTFYLRLYGVRHMVNDHSDSEKGNPPPPHRLLLSINSKGSFICTIPQTG